MVFGILSACYSDKKGSMLLTFEIYFNYLEFSEFYCIINVINYL